MEELKQYSVIKEFMANKLYGDITVKPVVNAVRPAKLQVKRFKVGDTVSVKPVKKWDGEQFAFIVGTELDHDVDSLYTIPQPMADYMQEIVAEKKGTTTTDRYFLGMTKKTTILVGTSLLVAAMVIGGFIYYKKFHTK